MLIESSIHKNTTLLFAIALVGSSFFCSTQAFAQTTVEIELIIEDFDPDSSYSLSVWALPNSIKVFVGDSAMDSDHWVFDKLNGSWRVKPEFLSSYNNSRHIRILYSAYPLALRRVFQNREKQELDSLLFATEGDTLRNELLNFQEQNSFNDSDLEQTGSLSRGIIVGTNQDFALESGLQFELSGQLTDDVSILASLTDKSIPIQPDGSTQNLREFDRVFIQLQSKNSTLEMGDVDASFEQSTFARLNRRLQGATGYTTTKYGDYKGALSVVRGTFKSLTFEGQDGVQGPYRLTGRDGDEFVIILAGTERVYINGERVQRGEENDYVIDYGLGELSFTNSLLIKDETRIIVEYEYVDQNFNRTLIAAEAGEDFLNGRLKIGASIIRQADGDELLSQQSLNEDDINVLRGVGDNLDAAIVSGERLANEDDENNILYSKVDTTFNGQPLTIFKNIPGSTSSIYIVRFTKVEDGSGSYKRISGSVNGLLYEWVGPGFGDYEAFRKLPAPEQQQMVAINGSFDINRNVEFYGEWAASGYDQNRFSGLNDADNNDFSYLSGFKVKDWNTGIGKVDASISRRYSGGNFEFFERTRDVEFERKWNTGRDSQSEESINEASISLSPSQQTSFQTEYGFVDRLDYKGYRQGFSLASDEPNLFSISYKQDWVNSSDDILNQKGKWFRQRGSIGREVMNGLTPYFGFEHENRIQRNSSTDSLLNSSFSFFELGPGIRFNRPSLDVDASIYIRSEDGVLDNTLRDEATAIEQRLKLDFSPNQFISTRNEVSVRSKSFTKDFELDGATNRRGLLIRSVTSYEAASEFINGQLQYEANTERRALLQETYFEVGPELGQFVWIDDNRDGVQQVDEFFPELSVNEGTFIKQFLPSDDLFPVIDLKVRFRNEIRPFKALNQEEGVGVFLKGIQVRSRFDIAENSTTEELSDVYLLNLGTFRNDSTTVQGRLFWEKELDLFSDKQKFDILLGYNENKTLNQRSSESLKQSSDLFYLNGSVRVTNRTRLYTEFTSSTNTSISNRLSSRNFDIKSYAFNPGLETTINRSWQTNMSVSYASKEDRFPGEPVTAQILKFINTHRAFLWKKVQANARIEIRNAKVEGSSSSLGNYELTEGTGLGTNLVWSVTGTYRLSDLIRLSFNYDGRTVEDRPDIHTTKLVISAVF